MPDVHFFLLLRSFLLVARRAIPLVSLLGFSSLNAAAPPKLPALTKNKELLGVGYTKTYQPLTIHAPQDLFPSPSLGERLRSADKKDPPPPPPNPPPTKLLVFWGAPGFRWSFFPLPLQYRHFISASLLSSGQVARSGIARKTEVSRLMYVSEEYPPSSL